MWEDLAEIRSLAVDKYHQKKGVGKKLIQQCLKEISTVDLARALKGIDGQAQIKVFKNLPKRSAAILQETVEHLDLMRESEMTEAQEKMLLVIADLEKQPDQLISTN